MFLSVAIYLTYFMMVTTLSVTCAVLVIRMHYKSVEQPPPQWLRVLIFHHLARLVCMDHQHRFSRLLHAPKPGGAIDGGDSSTGRPYRDMTISDGLTDETRSDYNAYSPDTAIPSCRRSSRESYELTLRHNNHTGGDNTIPNNDPRLRYVPAAMLNPSHGHRKFYESLDATVVNEWRKMAEVLDRFCFWMFLVFLIVPTASILGIMRLFKPVL